MIFLLSAFAGHSVIRSNSLHVTAASQWLS